MLRAHPLHHHQSQYFHPFSYHYTMSDIQPYQYQSSPLSMDHQPHIQANSAKCLLAEPGYLRRVIQDPRHQTRVHPAIHRTEHQQDPITFHCSSWWNETSSIQPASSSSTFTRPNRTARATFPRPVACNHRTAL